MTRTRTRNGEPCWQYADEINFINGLGTHAQYPSELRVKELLTRYIAATAERTEVFAIRARAYAVAKLNKLK